MHIMCIIFAARFPGPFPELLGGCQALLGNPGAGGSGVQDGGGIPSDIPGEGIGRRFHTPAASLGLARRI